MDERICGYAFLSASPTKSEVLLEVQGLVGLRLEEVSLE